MPLRIYNTLTKTKDTFTSLESGKVKMYVCGPTVYDLMHVGNFRGAVFFNLVRNWLERQGYDVTFIYNYTDVDDKIINRAAEEGLAPLDLSAKYIKAFEEDYARLKLRGHSRNPKVTDCMEEIVRFVQTLIDRKKAYVIDGEVFYSIDSFDGYGRLSRKNLEELQAGYRIDVDPRKRNPLDFVLWKPSKDGEPSWDSPWGRGRPGWHIECSTMSRLFLGDTIDIHGGGIDLIFPHHENEIAQSEGATGRPFVRYWMHNNFINFGDEKMSKSLGNVVKARDFMGRYHPEILKFMMLSVHYRSVMSLAPEQIRQAIAGLARVYAALAAAGKFAVPGPSSDSSDGEFEALLKQNGERIEEALNDDFNTPVVLACIFEVVKAFNALQDQGKKAAARIHSAAGMFCLWVRSQGVLMSLFAEPPAEFLKELDYILMRDKNIKVEDVEQKIKARATARAGRDFQAADKIRLELAEIGIDLHDSAEGTTWEMRKGTIHD